MPKFIFPDGRSQVFHEGVNGFLIAESISKSLLKKLLFCWWSSKRFIDELNQDAN